MSIFIPTYLYIKQHSVTKKLYLGKTVQDPDKYKGSGKRWLHHIKKHGKEHVETLWYCLFLEPISLRECALTLSNQYNIKHSSDWLNLINEDGQYGGIRRTTTSEEHRRKISEAMTGKKRAPFSKTTREKMSISAKNRSKDTRKSKRKPRGRPTPETIEKIRQGNLRFQASKLDKTNVS